MDCFFLDEAKELKDQSWSHYVAPLVTISCTTFNHDKFIRLCIEKFLLQKTRFPVEILIHDDASEDGTAEIVREYQRAYPGLIKATLQIQNKFSKGEAVNSINFPLASGKYIALCHGDDYWIDSHKLQLQVEMMIKYKVGISGHPAELININGEYLGGTSGYRVGQVTHFGAAELISRNGNMMPFGSIMIDQGAKTDIIKYMPPVQFHTGIQMLGALRSGLLVLPNIMSAYRVDVPGSATEIFLKKRSSIIQTTCKRVASIKSLRDLYSPRFKNEFDKLLAGQVLSKTHNVGIKGRFVILAEVFSGEEVIRSATLMPALVSEALSLVKRRAGRALKRLKKISD